MELSGFLTWLIGGGGGTLVAYWLMENVPALQNLASEYKRYLSLAIAGLVACAAFGVSVGLGYREAPAGWQGWLEALFAVIGLAIGGSQAIHGRLNLKSR
jgi:hypothetical protein